MTTAPGTIKRKARATKKQQPGDYIDNEKFFKEISVYREEYMTFKDLPKEEQKIPPRMSEYLGYCFWKISENLSKSKSFYGYTFREDMIADGYTDCVRYAHVFDPTRGNNPFAYFTAVCRFAFIRKIEKEKKQFYTVCKAISNSEIFGLLSDHQDSDENAVELAEIGGYTKESRLQMAKFIEDYEGAQQRKIDKNKKKADDLKNKEEDLESKNV